MKVLITAVSGPTAIGIIKCLINEPDIEIVGTDIYKNSIGKKWLKKVYEVPKHDSIDEYRNKLCEIISKEKIDIVFPTLQEELLLVNSLADELGIFSATVKNYPLERLLNKETIYVDLTAKGLEKYIPNYGIYTNEDTFNTLIEEKFDNNDAICTKKISGHGGKGFAIISLNKDNQIENLEKGFIYVEDYKLFLRKSNNKAQMMLCDYIEGEEISVDILRHEKEIKAITPRVRSKVSTGIVIDGKTSKIDRIIEAATEIVEAFDIEGFLNVQFIYNDKQTILIDLNPRFCGSQVMSFGAGVNYPNMICNIAKGNRVEAITPKWNIETRRYWESIFYDEKGNII